jgi:beta-glucanase (GH16 family)
MRSQFGTGYSISLPWSSEERNPEITRFLDYLRARKHYKRASKAVLASSTIVLITLIGHYTSPNIGSALHQPFNWMANNGVSAAPTEKATTPPATPTCAGAEQSEDTVSFAACPSFSLNFANEPLGTPSEKAFNIYTGAPEANQEAQLYTSSTNNLQVKGGTLNLTALNKAQEGFRYTSARIDTEHKEDFMYGKLMVRATLPDTIGSWPAIWMLPTDHKYENMSPDTDFSRYLNDGEIDIAESAGVEPHVIYGIAHSRAYPPNGPNRNYYNTVKLPDNATTLHTYEVTWTPTSLSFSVDGKSYFTITKQPGADYRSWPYDQHFYLILNLAVGGTWAGEDRADFPLDGVDTKALPTTMHVQSINYYPYVQK